ncbi:MAG: hypothetical protein J6D54_11690 [Olsenella sp.]|nr:hypothetical protein [Olsenella sp.]
MAHHTKGLSRRRRLEDFPCVPYFRTCVVRETYMLQAGILDSVNAAAHGRRKKVGYFNYQRPENVDAALQAGSFLVVKGGLDGKNCI